MVQLGQGLLTVVIGVTILGSTYSCVMNSCEHLREVCFVFHRISHAYISHRHRQDRHKVRVAGPYTAQFQQPPHAKRELLGKRLEFLSLIKAGCPLSAQLVIDLIPINLIYYLSDNCSSSFTIIFHIYPAKRGR